MKSSRAIEVEIGLVILLCFVVFLPVAVLAGHGVEDTVDTITADRAKQLLDSGEKIFFVDLRPAKEFEQNRLPGAHSIPLPEITKRFNEIPKTGRVILYCDCKPYDISDRAVFLEYRGYRNIFVMSEGFPGWVKRGYPLETTRR
jgi:rhodanese-related sulfurtransferase